MKEILIEKVKDGQEIKLKKTEKAVFFKVITKIKKEKVVVVTSMVSNISKLIPNKTKVWLWH
jgi:hypothetical protein